MFRLRKAFLTLLLAVCLVGVAKANKIRCNPFVVPWTADVYIYWSPSGWMPEDDYVYVTLWSQQWQVPVAGREIHWSALPKSGTTPTGNYMISKISFTAADEIFLSCADGLVVEVIHHATAGAFSAEFTYDAEETGMHATIIPLWVEERNPLNESD